MIKGRRDQQQAIEFRDDQTSSDQATCMETDL